MKIRMIFLALIAVTLLFVPSNTPTQTLSCNSDSLRVLARVYPSRFIDDQLLQQQADCFAYNRVTVLDTILHWYGNNWMQRDYLINRIDKLLARLDNDSTTIADLYYFKGCAILEAVHELEFSDTLKGLEYMDSTLAYDKKYHLAWYNKGIIFLMIEELDKSRNCFERAIRIDSSHIHYWLHYGVSLHLNGNENSAKRAFEVAVEVSGKRFEDFLFIADEQRGWRLSSQATQWYDSALTRKQDNPDAWFNLASAVYDDDSAKDIRHYLDSALEYFDGENLSFHFVPFADDLGFYDYSIRYLDKVLSKDWSNAVLWWYKSNHVFMSGDTGSAVEYLDSVIKYDSAYIFEDGNLFKAWQLTNYGLYNEALSYLDQSKVSSDDTVSVLTYYYYKAICKYRLKEYIWASAICDTLVPLFPEDTSVIILCDSIQDKLEEQ